MVVGKGALVDDLGTEFDEALEEAFRNGDAGDGTDTEPTKIREWLGFPGEEIFEMKRVMGAGEDLGVILS